MPWEVAEQHDGRNLDPCMTTWCRSALPAMFSPLELVKKNINFFFFLKIPTVGALVIGSTKLSNENGNYNK